MTSDLRNLWNEKPGGLRDEQQQKQQPRKLRKLTTDQNAALQAGSQHPAF